MTQGNGTAGGGLFCTFHVGGLYFGVDVRSVQEVIRWQAMTPVPLAPSVVEGLINLRGQIVTAIDLRRRLEIPERSPEKLPMHVVVRTEDDVVSLLVDSIDEVVEVDAAAFERAPDTLRGVPRELIQGVFKLEDRLLLVLDTEKTVDIAPRT